jgi:hypothetical protein
LITRETVERETLLKRAISSRVRAIGLGALSPIGVKKAALAARNPMGALS